MIFMKSQIIILLLCSVTEPLTGSRQFFKNNCTECHDSENAKAGLNLEQIARVATKLEKVPEGYGTRLDNTLIVYLSDAAETHHGSCIEWPFVLLGGLAPGGGNDYLQYTEQQQSDHYIIVNLYNSFMDMLD